MRIIWLTFAVIALVAAGVIWTFAAGWAGRIVFFPDPQQLSSGEWPGWLIMLLLTYGPIAFGAWCGFKALKANDAAD